MMGDRGRLRFGASVEGGPLAGDQLQALAATVAEAPSFVLWFEDFGASPPVAGVEAAIRAAADPIVTWEPWESRVMEGIAAGERDDHLEHWAAEFAAFETPIYLRFAHEFNGDWYPWTPAGGTSPATFQAAWRHIHDVFSRQAHSVQWVWCPNAVSTSSEPLTDWYPGDDYVDLLGVDGYNWGDAKDGSEWLAPAALFDPVIGELQALDAQKQILIAEVASAESGGSKARWITEFVDYVAAHPALAGFVWFEHDKETDWRMVSTDSAASAMAEALREADVVRGVAI
jgi:hypothetical protein